jgi:dGTPase
MRTDYMRDRDRIVHSKAFRRLKHKTQVFISPVGDHFVTRLTHTIEVSQVARSISRALRLNEDLTEAIALGHDLGHTPFGHLGEIFLDRKLPGGYAHAQQSLRVVDHLEKEGQGLNLTWEVRQGILHHSKGRGSLEGLKQPEEGLTLEAQVCRLSDALAYVNHDLMDAIRAGIVTEDDIPSHLLDVLGRRHSERLNTLIGDVVESSWAVTGETPLPPGERPIIQMSPAVNDAMIELREFLFERVYIPAGAGPAGEEAREVLDLLWNACVGRPERIPAGYALTGDPVERRAADYISGMTDTYAVRMAEMLRHGEDAVAAGIAMPAFKGWR